MNTVNQNVKRLLDGIESEVRYTASYIGKKKLDKRVMQAMATVPREEFVPEHLRKNAFDNGPLPIGHGQTISQPYIVALMSDLLDLKPQHHVLEIGTGSGYQTAILAQLCKKVFTVERIDALSKLAVARFQRLKYKNIEARIGGGHQGWKDDPPSVGTLVTTAAPHVFPQLIR